MLPSCATRFCQMWPGVARCNDLKMVMMERLKKRNSLHFLDNGNLVFLTKLFSSSSSSSNRPASIASPDWKLSDRDTRFHELIYWILCYISNCYHYTYTYLWRDLLIQHAMLPTGVCIPPPKKLFICHIHMLWKHLHVLVNLMPKSVLR